MGIISWARGHRRAERQARREWRNAKRALREHEERSWRQQPWWCVVFFAVIIGAVAAAIGQCIAEAVAGHAPTFGNLAICATMVGALFYGARIWAGIRRTQGEIRVVLSQIKQGPVSWERKRADLQAKERATREASEIRREMRKAERTPLLKETAKTAATAPRWTATGEPERRAIGVLAPKEKKAQKRL
jgi:hypothetical protein